MLQVATAAACKFERTADEISRLPEWRLAPQPSLKLGDAENEESGSVFFRVTGVRALANGRVLVVTDASKQYIEFDESGEALRTRGRSGSGPGEFRHVQLLASSSTSDTIVLLDMLQRRLTLANVADTSETTPLVVSFREASIGRVIPQLRFQSRFLLARNDGPLPDATPSGTVRQLTRLVLLDSLLEAVADLGQFPADEMIVRDDPNDGFWYGEPTPFPSRLLLAANDSVIFVSPGGPFEILMYDAVGALRRVLRVADARRPVTKAMTEQYRARVMVFATDPVSTKEWTALSRDDVFPANLPAFDQMLVDRQGLLWLRRTVVEGDTQAEWVVVKSDGALVARLEVPAALTLHDIDEGSVLGVWTDEMKREQIRRYTLNR